MEISTRVFSIIRAIKKKKKHSIKLRSRTSETSNLHLLLRTNISSFRKFAPFRASKQSSRLTFRVPDRIRASPFFFFSFVSTNRYKVQVVTRIRVFYGVVHLPGEREDVPGNTTTEVINSVAASGRSSVMSGSRRFFFFFWLDEKSLRKLIRRTLGMKMSAFKSVADNEFTFG